MASAGRRCWEGDNLAGGAAAGIGSAPVLTHHEQRRIDIPAERAPGGRTRGMPDVNSTRGDHATPSRSRTTRSET